VSWGEIKLRLHRGELAHSVFVGVPPDDLFVVIDKIDGALAALHWGLSDERVRQIHGDIDRLKELAERYPDAAQALSEAAASIWRPYANFVSTLPPPRDAARIKGRATGNPEGQARGIIARILWSSSPTIGAAEIADFLTQVGVPTTRQQANRFKDAKYL